jgi:hypothetical protein
MYTRSLTLTRICKRRAAQYKMYITRKSWLNDGRMKLIEEAYVLMLKPTRAGAI